MVNETNAISNNESFCPTQIEINLRDQAEIPIPSTNYASIEETNQIKKNDKTLEKGSCLKEILQILQIWWLCEQLGLCDIKF
jgi:hypothetical protein